MPSSLVLLMHRDWSCVGTLNKLIENKPSYLSFLSNLVSIDLTPALVSNRRS